MRTPLGQILANPRSGALVEIQAVLNRATHEFFEANKISVVDLPMTTNSVSSPMGLGSDSLPVQVPLRGGPTFLADSMQFYLELACRLVGGSVGYKMVCFRGEDADDTHLNQFHHIECELPGGLDDAMRSASALVLHLTARLQSGADGPISQFTTRRDHIARLLSTNIPTIRYSDAMTLLRAHEGCLAPLKGTGTEVISRAGERRLCMVLDCDALWLTHHPRLATPFYQAQNPDRRSESMTADLILGGLETVGAGARHASAEDVCAALSEHGVDQEPYSWYCEMRRGRSVSTSGFGLGVERFLMWLLCQDDIASCCLLPRRGRPTEEL